MNYDADELACIQEFKKEVEAGGLVWSLLVEKTNQLAFRRNGKRKTAVFFSDKLRADLYNIYDDTIVASIPFYLWEEQVLPGIIQAQDSIGINWDEHEFSFKADMLRKALS